MTVDGVDYPSRKKAAEALGCSQIKIRDYVNRGGKWAAGRAKPVTVLGVTYPSMRAASAAIGCAQNYVSVVVNRGGEPGPAGPGHAPETGGGGGPRRSASPVAPQRERVTA